MKGRCLCFLPGAFQFREGKSFHVPGTVYHLGNRGPQIRALELNHDPDLSDCKNKRAQGNHNPPWFFDELP